MLVKVIVLDTYKYILRHGIFLWVREEINSVSDYSAYFDKSGSDWYGYIPRRYCKVVEDLEIKRLNIRTIRCL